MGLKSILNGEDFLLKLSPTSEVHLPIVVTIDGDAGYEVNKEEFEEGLTFTTGHTYTFSLGGDEFNFGYRVPDTGVIPEVVLTNHVTFVPNDNCGRQGTQEIVLVVNHGTFYVIAATPAMKRSDWKVR